MLVPPVSAVMSMCACCRSTDYASDLCVCLLRHRIAHRGDPPSQDDLWAEASELFGTLPGVNCPEIRSGRVQQAQPLLTDDEGAASDADISNTDSASEGARQVLLQRARQAQAQVRASNAEQARPAADTAGGAGGSSAGGSVALRAAAAGAAEVADAAAGFGDASSDADGGTAAGGDAGDAETTADEGGDAEVAHRVEDDDAAKDAEFTDGPAPTALETADGAAADVVDDAGSGGAAAAHAGDGAGGCMRSDAQEGSGSGPLDLGRDEAAGEPGHGDDASACASGGEGRGCTRSPSGADQALPCEPTSAEDPPRPAEKPAAAGGDEAAQGGGSALAGFLQCSLNGQDDQAGPSASPDPLQDSVAAGAGLEGVSAGGSVLPPSGGVADGESAGLALPTEGLLPQVRSPRLLCARN